MTTRAQFRQAVRDELADPGPVYVWADSLLNGFINEAIGQLSVDWPLIRFWSTAGVVGQRDYTIPATQPVGPRGIHSVEYPAGFLLAQGDTSAQYEGVVNSNPPQQTYDQRWEFIRQAGDSQELRFRYNLADTQPIQVQFYGIYTTLAADTDVLDVGGFDEEALKWATCYRAMAWLDEMRGKRGGQTGYSVAGNRGGQGYYQQLYNQAIAARKTAKGIGVSRLVVEG